MERKSSATQRSKRHKGTSAVDLRAALVDSSNDAIVSAGLDGIITSWNRAAEQLYGYSSKESVGRPISILLQPDRADEMETILHKIRQKEHVDHFDTIRIRKDKGAVAVSLAVSPILDGAGEVIGASSIARDITERKRAEEQAGTASLYARSLIEASLDPLVTISTEGKITDVNAGSIKVTGVPREKLIGTDFSDYFTEPDKAREGYLQVFSKGFVADYPLTIRHRNGTLTHVLYNASVYEDAQGKVLGVFAAARDVTARRKAEALVAKQRTEELESLEELLPKGHIAPRARDVRARERTAEASAGFAATATATGAQQDRDFGRPEYARAVLNILEDFGEKKRRLEDAQRAVLNIVEDLDIEKRKAQEANRMKSEFLANMSHELRTPLNAIMGFTKLMAHGKVGPVSAQHQEFLGDILKSSNHLLQLINDVLDLAKVEAGKMEFFPERVDLVGLVNEVRDVLRPLAALKHIHVETEFDPTCTSPNLDPGKLRQVLYNYLSNALKFTQDQGRVVVRVRAEDADFFRVEVEDTGIGISPDDLTLLFSEFRQLDSSASKKYQGTGLGLALTRRLVQAQGGRVGASSTLGTGSTFFAVLPRSAGS